MNEIKENNRDIRLKNLELGKWKPGQSGNPNGRTKKEFSLTEGMRQYMLEKDPERKKERKDILIEKTFSMAQRGDIAAIKLLWSYIEGMPKGFTGDTNIVNVIPILGNKTNVHFDESNTEDPAIKETN